MVNLRPMRKDTVGLLGVLVLVVLQAIPVQAITYTPDQLLGGIDSIPFGLRYEEGQLEAFCSCQVSFLSSVNNNIEVFKDDNGNRYIDVSPATPGYFVLKFGAFLAGKDMFFFRNNPDYTKLVWNLSQLKWIELVLQDDVKSLSYYDTVTASPPAAVSEPASLLLLGSGLVGIGLWRRGQKRRTFLQ